MDENTEMSGTQNLLDLQTERMNEHIRTQEDLRISLLVKAVVTESLRESNLSEEEQRWVRLAIKREARIEAFRTAVIEKTLTGIIWAAVVAVGYALWEYFKIKVGTRS